MEFKSQELQNAEPKQANSLATPADNISTEQLKQTIEKYLASKDYNLVKHFTHNNAIGTQSITSEDVLYSIIKCVRLHYINQIRADEANYHERQVIIDKIFDSIKNLVDVIAVHNIKVSKNELLAAMIGNTLKSLT